MKPIQCFGMLIHKYKAKRLIGMAVRAAAGKHYKWNEKEAKKGRDLIKFLFFFGSLLRNL